MKRIDQFGIVFQALSPHILDGVTNVETVYRWNEKLIGKVCFFPVVSKNGWYKTLIMLFGEW